MGCILALVDGPSVAGGIRVQRGQTVLPEGFTTETLSAGTDYLAPQGPAFVRIVGTRLTGVGRTLGGGAQAPEDWMAWIENTESIDQSFTIGRYASTTDDRVAWELIEFIGSPADEQALSVLGQATLELPAGDLSSQGDLVVAGDDDDVVVFITGQAVASNGRLAARGLFTAEWDAGNGVPVLTRSEGGDPARVSYAIVEFTGPRWQVQVVEHVHADAVEATETLPVAVDQTQSFLHVQHRSASSLLGALGTLVFLEDATTVRFDTAAGADHTGRVTTAWIVTDTGNGADTMLVEHVAGSRSMGPFEEDVWSDALAIPKSTGFASIMGEGAVVESDQDDVPVGSVGLVLGGPDTVELTQSEGGIPITYRFSVVNWPMPDAVFADGFEAAPAKRRADVTGGHLQPTGAGDLQSTGRGQYTGAPNQRPALHRVP